MLKMEVESAVAAAEQTVLNFALGKLFLLRNWSVQINY